MMKIQVLLAAFSLSILIGLTGCNQQDSQSLLFSGTLPLMESGKGAQKSHSEARSLFIRLLKSEVEYEGNLYALEVLEESDGSVHYAASFPLNAGLSVHALTLNKDDHTLELELAGTDRKVLLTSHAHLLSQKVSSYATVDLTADISQLNDKQKEMLRILFRVADIMEELYWKQVFPERDAALGSMLSEDAARFFRINYGPWERLNGNLPFLPGYGPKPAGSGYYPADMSREEFDALEDPAKNSQYTLLTRNAEGALLPVPYHEAYATELQEAAGLLIEAATLAEDEGFRKYLELRAEALLSDDYLASDLAWMDMKDNAIDFVVGPIENYEDALYNYKAAHEAFILIKDREWSEKLEFIASVLPEMQRSLPVAEAYKQEVPGSGSDLGVYDVVYYAGDCNAGSKTIAINLPNDERVHASKGSRKLQLKNAIRYKFEEILVPISDVLIDESQRAYLSFDAFFENIMFHEVAHGLGINQTLDGQGSVRSALREQYSALEEGKADILALFLITEMTRKGMLGEKELMENYVTFMASIFRSIRFGVASSHGKANMIRFYYFQEAGAFSRSETNGSYRINFEKMQKAMNDLARLILTTQGDGNYELAKKMVEEQGFIREELQADLERLQELNIPVDIVFHQGPELLGL